VSTPPTRPDVPPPRGPRLSRRSLLWLGLSGLVDLVALGAIVGLAHDHEGVVPPTAVLAAAGIVVAAVSVVAVGLAARAAGAPMRAAITLAGGMACIALVKFTFGPLGLYQVNQHRAFESTVSAPGDVIIIIGVGVLALYWAAILVLAALFRGRAGADEPKAPAIAVGAFLGVGGLIVGGALALPNVQYVSFVFASASGAVVAILLFVAAVLVGGAFHSASTQARTTGNASMYVSLFWLALAFILLFQVLWIVYLLALVAIWPLRTVTPK
jgi:hypothetical protein